MKTVKFTYHEQTAEYGAEFFDGKALVSSKSLTSIEVDALEEYLSSDSPSVIDANELYDEVDYLYFDTDNGELTNFEEMLQELVNR